MPEKDTQNLENPEAREPQGFTVHSSGLASEYAREQGWGTNEDERTQTPQEKQDYDGGRNYEYGAQDFGDTAKDTGSAQAQTERKTHQPRQKKSA